MLTLLDRAAAGHGWFIDATPEYDEEYAWYQGELIAQTQTAATVGMDLLTVVMHEIGHVLGLKDLAEETYGDRLMSEELELGARHLPEIDHVASNKFGLSSAKQISRFHYFLKEQNRY